MTHASLLWPELVSYLDTFTQPHILVDRNYRILAANHAYRSAWGDVRDVVGRACYEISHGYSVPCDRAGESCPRARCLDSGKRERAVHLHHTKNGEAYENIEISPVRDGRGDIVGFVERLEPLRVARGLSGSAALVGRSPAFARMLELVSRVAPSEAAVLLLGESGTGKELVARAIHDASRRADRPFAVIDSSGLPETLFESEIFGHERGAFTGATARKTGLVEAASGGTLFLDEVGDLPLSLQVKLLRLLETGTYRRVGSTELQSADVRLVSATNRPLEDMVAAGRFRQDLYFRLNTFPIQLPTLAERAADIPMLVTTLLERIAPKREVHVAPGAFALLRSYSYPGNVRELRHVLEWAVLMCDGRTIEPEHLPDRLRQSAAREGLLPAASTPTLKDLEAEALRALAAQPGRRTRRALAKSLGISERTLYRKLAAARKFDSD